MPIVKMPDGQSVSFPDNFESKDIQAFIYEHFPDTNPINKGNEFTRGVGRGVQTTKALIEEGVPAVAKGLANKNFELLGDEESQLDPTENLLEYQRKVEEAYEQFPTKTPSFTDIHSPVDAGSYIASAAGEQIPQLGLSLLGGGGTGFFAKKGLQTLAKRQGKELTEKQLQKVLKNGIAAGTLASSGSQNIPETYFNLLAQGEDEATTAVMVGALKTGLDVMPQIEILKRVLGDNASDILTDSLLKRLGKEAGSTALKEGVTEASQEGLDLIAEQFILDNPDMFSQENIVNLIDAGLKGAVGGGTIGAGVSLVQSGVQQDRIPFDYDKLSSEKKQEVDLMFQEQVVGKAQPKANDVGLDDSILSPLYVDDTTLQNADSLGVSKESLVLVPPKSLEATQEALNRLETAFNIPEVYTPVDQSAISQDLTVRRSQLDANERTDTDFILGDGEIVKGAPVNPSSTIRSTLGRLATTNSSKLEATPLARQPSFEPVTENTFTLPKSLGQPKPRWKQSPLEFASDLDKVAYIVANPKQSSKRHKDYVKWITDVTGMKEADIVLQGKEIRKNIQKAELNLGKKTDPISVPRQIEPVKLQQLNLPFNGNLRDDLVVPKLVSNNLKGVRLSPKAEQDFSQIINQMRRIVKETAGPGVRFEPFERLVEGLTNEPVAGAQFANVIALAINEKSFKTVDETMYHELWHFFEGSGSLTQEDLAIIDKQTHLLQEYMNDDGYLNAMDFDVFTMTEAGREELRANAFGKWAKEKRAGIRNDKTLPSKFKFFFNKARSFLEKTGNALDGLGFKSLEDVFNDTLEGRNAPVSETLDNINYINKQARFQKIAEQYQDAHNQLMSNQDFDKIVQDARIDANKITQVKGKNIGGYTRYLRSFADAASDNPFLAQAYEMVSRKVAASSKYLEDYLLELGDFPNKDKAVRHRLHELADYLRKTNQKANIDEDGLLTYEKDGNIVRINNPEIAQAYTQMQNGYARVLTDYEKTMKEEAFKEFGEDVLLTPNFSVQQAINARNSLAKEKDTIRKVERLDNLIEVLTDLNRMKGTSFVPHMRFGNWGFTVRDKESGEQVAFYTVEGGSFRKLYNKFQLENTLKTIGEKYSDTSKYEVIGGNGRITSFNSSSAVPFKMTYDELRNNIDPRFINIEMLSSLLASKDVDMKMYEEMRNEIYNDILQRGFKRRFSESKGLDGYSTDWDRVQHAYLTGASHYLSSIPQQRELATLKDEATKLIDDRLKEKVLKYLDYNNSPSEDFVMLRSFNFLWTMGGNLSTAALQLMTMPTTTLGSMTQYNPNVIQNMKYIGKWFGLAINSFAQPMNKTIYVRDGLVHIDFSDRAHLDKLVSEGTLTKYQADFIEKVSKSGKIRGLLTEEYSGFKPFETRSLGGSTKAKLSNFANFAGMPISVMEQLTRFATTMATFEMLENSNKNQKRAKNILKNDYRFQAQLQHRTDFDFLENVAMFSMDEAHAVFGKQGRSEVMKGLGGALIIPFMTYPQQALEFIARTYGRGADGKRAMMTTLGSLFILSGLMGLPGAELLKELLEELEKQMTGSEEDFDFLIREKIYEQTGDATFAKFITQGVGRAYGELDVARRIGLPIPGQDLLMLLLGIRGEASDVLGVSGSLLEGIALGWNEFNNDGSMVNVASAMMPVAPANVLKAYQMTQEGVSTRKGTQLVTPEDITAKSVLARTLGITSDQIATEREELYARMLTDNKYTTAMERFRTRAKKAVTNLNRARRAKDFDEVKKQEQKYKDILSEMQEYAKMNGIVPDFQAFNRSVLEGAKQRLDPTIRPQDARKLARKDFIKIQEALGIEKK